MAEHDLFEAEQSALHDAERVHAQDRLDAAVYRGALGILIEQFRRLVRQARRVIVHSDRQERELTALNARLRQLAAELDYKATHDPLTGAYNRRAVIERADALLQSGPIALIVVDIDHFKRINDDCGHPAGDAVIVGLVARLRSVAPAIAELGRVGGEEFTVLLPGVDMPAAMDLAETMRVRVSSTPFEVPGRNVTASFGVSVTEQGRSFDVAYGGADAALYEAKRAGRNRVRAANGAQLQS
jgi:diguanylate cyclase (GGDEF)-like protein